MSSSLSSIAARNVARNWRRSAITLVAILLGVTAVIVLRGISDGFVHMMQDDLVQGRTGALQVHRKGYVDNLEALPLELNMPYDDSLRALIRGTPGVTGVTGRIQFSGLVSNGISETMFIGRGLDMATEREAIPRAGSDVREGGEPLANGDFDRAVLGGELAQSFGVMTMAALQKAQQAGTLTEAQQARVTLSSSSPQGRANSYDVLVKGLSDASLPYESKRVATVPLALAQSLVGLEGRVTEYAVSVDDMKNLELIAAALRTRLGPEYEVHTWQQLQPLVRDGIMRLQFVLGFVSFILGIIIITSIVNVMLMSVFERVREIGTMMAVGVRRIQVLTLFLLEAGLIGLMGSLGGVALGGALVSLIASKGIPMQSVGTSAQTILRPELHPPFMIVTVAFAIAGAIAAASYPAWRASRMNPVDALRSV